MDDDFNSAGAIGALFDLIKTYNKVAEKHDSIVSGDKAALTAVKSAILDFDSVLGLFKNGFPGRQDALPAEIQALVDKRQAARRARDFKTADAVRAELEKAGYILEDRPDGVRVRRK
jgi:cysteinyl-tRNA synthetase